MDLDVFDSNRYAVCRKVYVSQGRRDRLHNLEVVYCNRVTLGNHCYGLAGIGFGVRYLQHLEKTAPAGTWFRSFKVTQSVRFP